jgi:hypothetical protein
MSIHTIIPAEIGIAKGTEALEKEIAQEILIEDRKHTTAQLFEGGQSLGNKQRDTRKDTKDSESTGP